MSCRVTTPRVSPRAASLMALGSSLALAFSSPLSADLLENGSFEAGLEGWSTTGDVSLARGGWDGDGSVVLRPGPGATATLSQVVTGLEPRARYTVAARIRTTDRLSPPILGIRNGAQIAKAHGWVATGDEGRWLERRFEVHADEDATSFEVYLQAWQTDDPVVIEFDAVRLWKDRQAPPEADPGEAPWSGAPVVDTKPVEGESLLRNPAFDDPTGGAWALGIEATIEQAGPDGVLRLLSTEDTSRASQVIVPDLPPNGSWILSMETRVDPGVVASAYLTGSDEFLATRSFGNTDWALLEIPIESGANWIRNGKLTLENWKNQPGSAWYRNVSFRANGDEWVPTLASPPAVQSEVFFDDFSDGELDPEHWLVSAKAWGGDNGGVAPANVKLVPDLDDGEPIVALRLEAHGDLYSGDLEHNGRTTRVGAAIATRRYFASGRYEVRARVAPEYGTCTAFWPFHYIDHRMGEAEYWHEPNPRRNTEIDWEFPTDLGGADLGEFSFTKARTNSWGGQFGGEGGEHKGRKVLTDEDGAPLDLAAEAMDGRYHTFTIEWRSGEDLGDEAINRSRTGSVRWLLDGRLVDELHDVDFGQGNVPYRAARFWLGTWFPAAGYADYVGWTGDPIFDVTAAHIAWVRITPFNEPRDEWVDETVPNLAWATPDEYPVAIDPPSGGPADLDGDGWVDGVDLGLLIAAWGAPQPDLDGSGAVDGGDFGVLLAAWSPEP
ncbi:MAG: glycoside hydrolase family 16 protein [Planctomycetota bacterium]|nr:glycoside hydrolase family 16 protein [Planctomycetota bacterium]